ncbi:MAG: hypothetical protein AB1601_16185 [Planctomycetota bacterium]
MTAISATTSPLTVWTGRLRFAAALGVVWAALHFLAGPLLPRGVDRPLVLVASPYGALAGLTVIGVVWLGAAITALLIGPQPRRAAMVVIGVALALWTAEHGRLGGTMDDWLIFRNEVPGPPRGAPYWGLLLDYLYLAVAIAGAHTIFGWVAARQTGHEPRAALRRAWGVGRPAREWRQGLMALAATTVVGGAAILLLMGPTSGWTLRGQVYFAVALGFFAGVFVANRLVPVRDALWFWPAPLVLGVIGVVAAGLWPALMLPPDCQLDTLPAWALARPLPIEMVGVGLAGGFWTLRPRAAHAPSAGYD